MKFGQWLRTMREKSGLSRNQLGERAGITGSTIGQIERGDIKRPPMKRLIAFSKVFKTSIHTIKSLILTASVAAIGFCSPLLTPIVEPFNPQPDFFISLIQTKHIVMFSGGKDSTAMLDLKVMADYSIDEVIFADLGIEFKAMYDHISLVERKTGVKITTVRPKKSFKYYFFDYVKTKGNSIGEKGYHWCGKVRWGTTLKKQTIKKYLKETANNCVIVEYHGITADEPARLKKNNDGRDIRYPLNDWNVSESQALSYCYDQGYTWSGLYNYLDRVSCFCCENKNSKEINNLIHHFPNEWAAIKHLEKKSGHLYKGKGTRYYELLFTT